MELVYLVLSTFAIAFVLTYTDGPWGMFYKLRNNEAVLNFGLFECFACVAFYCALLISLASYPDGTGLFFHVFAAMGGAIALDSLREL